MSEPHAFTWIEKPLLAALACPESPEELEWLRSQGIELLISLTEEAPRRDWVDNAGLLAFHDPMLDMEPPTAEQLRQAISAIHRAHEHQMGVAVHCGAGLGRTGVVLACYFVAKGAAPKDAIVRVRKLRPGSIETEEQEQSVFEFARAGEWGIA
jgi:atypical dual specificity phosphatase